MRNEQVEIELRQNFTDKEYAHAYAEDFSNGFIATQLKVLREDRQLTQAQLAELTGMKQSRISRIEDVNYGSWNLKTLRRLGEALDVALVVRFESFGSFIKDVASFSRESLRRPSRMIDLTASRSVEVVVSAASDIAFKALQNEQPGLGQSALAASSYANVNAQPLSAMEVGLGLGSQVNLSTAPVRMAATDTRSSPNAIGATQ